MADAAPSIQTTQRTVMIDPGHGGKQTGYLSGSGLMEKDFMLTLARKTARRLEERYNVFLTRMDDRLMTAQERVTAANRSGADLLISLHLHDGSIDTAFLYCYHLPEDPARIEKNTGAETWAGAALTRQAASLKAARFLADAFDSPGGGKVIKPYMIQAPVIALEGAQMPAVLMEMMSVSQIPAQASRREILMEQYAGAISHGIDQYFLHLSSGNDN